jgi:hypothetical protein
VAAAIARTIHQADWRPATKSASLRGAGRGEPPHLRQRGHARHLRPVADHERQPEHGDQQPDEHDDGRARGGPEQEQQRARNGRGQGEPGARVPRRGSGRPRGRVAGGGAQLGGVGARRAQPRGQGGDVDLATQLGGEVGEVGADVVEDLRDLGRREIGQRGAHAVEVLLGRRARQTHRSVVGHAAATSPSIVSANARHVFAISRRRSRPVAFRL